MAKMQKTGTRAHKWQWNLKDRSRKCRVSDDRLEVVFHPECSKSVAAIRGTLPLDINGNLYYWEIEVSDKVYGTSVMFGLCTKNQRLHMNDYCNLIGLDKEGWSLSHKGYIWHKGLRSKYTNEFPEDTPVTVGMLFDTKLGELSYFLNGKSLGVAFTGLNEVGERLYPVVGSTAKRTKMRLIKATCGFENLATRSSFALLDNYENLDRLIKYMERTRVPIGIIDHLSELGKGLRQTS